MKISLQAVGKQFNREWIFRGLSQDFLPGEAYAILGANGSGKSTLLQVINGNMQATEGKVTCENQGEFVPPGETYPHISIGLPYQELIWEFSLRESIRFQRHFKPFVDNMDEDEILEMTQLGKHADKSLRYFSSGMKQRARLALAILSHTPVLLLDEPCMNLDANGRSWFNTLLSNHRKDRLIIISSNHMEDEIRHCHHHIDIHLYKSGH